MKVFVFLLALAFTFQTVQAFSSASPAKFEVGVNNEESGSFKVLNDTGGEVQIHTGAGFVELNKGASTSITCEVGREIRRANKGKKGDVIFVVDDSMCGKTVKLSKYL